MYISKISIKQFHLNDSDDEDDKDDYDVFNDLVNFLLWAMADTNVLWPISQPLTPQGKEQDSLW